MDKVLRNAIIAGILIVAFSISYYLVIFLPKKEATRVELQKQDQEMKEQKEEYIQAEQVRKEEETAQLESIRKQSLEFCLSEAEDQYWNYMELNGTGKRYDENGVRASQNTWDIADKRKQQETSNCFQKYK